ncbi:MAG: 1-deoxy-D-xylulose-5-phosphate reductoisomerase [Gammaproteobacteria bacterium]|nr:1-deoxy-D-xylulose-5-phosphate reductoisomerase [Gammaproteobacteria bacterium]
MQKVVLLGSTGSVGKSSLEVIEKNKDEYEIACLVAFSNEDLIKVQAKRHKKAKIYLEKPKDKLSSKKLINKNDLLKLISGKDVDTVIAAISGSEGLELIHHSIESGKKVLIANKEPLVMAGEFIVDEAKKHGAQIIPIDSEHCSIHQSIQGKKENSISKITLTCSGGPFYSLPKSQFKNISPKQALKHPIWKMGRKITIDSSTLMNKALEIIEAKYLFREDPNKIEAIIHPEGLIHSLVEFCDGTILAAMALPDMKIPISYGLGFPDILENDVKKINLQKLKNLSFKPIDPKKFPSIDFAYFALNHEKGMPIILNAANEIAVELFLKNKISFLNIYKLISSTLNYADKSNMDLTSVSLPSILEFNEEAKKIALNFAPKNIR